MKRKWKNRENVYIEKISQSQPILMEIFVIDNAASIKCKGIPYDIIFIPFSKSSRQCHIHIDGNFFARTNIYVWQIQFGILHSCWIKNVCTLYYVYRRIIKVYFSSCWFFFHSTYGNIKIIRNLYARNTQFNGKKFQARMIGVKKGTLRKKVANWNSNQSSKRSQLTNSVWLGAFCRLNKSTFYFNLYSITLG